MNNHKLINEYAPPTAEDLQRLKLELGLKGVEMADLAGLGGGQQWRKYTGGAAPRAMAPQMLFFLAAQLALTPDELDRVLHKMSEIGAKIQ